MKISRFTLVLLVTMFLNCLCVHAKTVKDTLVTTDGDRIILTYEISRSEDHYTLRFNNQQKKLGRINGDKYADLSKVAVMFFDRTGGFSNNVSITNMVPEAFMVPSNVNYEHSSDGFFVVQDYPTLNFTAKGSSDITIPIYLAYHPKKGKYTLFSKCKGMKIHLSASSSTTRQQSPSQRQQGPSQITQQTVTSTTEIEADNTAALKVMESIKLAKELLYEADKLPFSESLQDEIRFIRVQKREITDAGLLSQISDVLQMYEDKKASLEENASAAQIAAQQKAEEKAKREAEEIQAKNDSIMSAQQEQAEKDKERNLWMIIGGVILAILAFIGNQVFQSFRNNRNQKNMMNIQQSIANQAEAEAKRRARNAIRSTTNRTVNQTKSAVREAVRKKTTIKVNGKSKNLSI